MSSPSVIDKNKHICYNCSTTIGSIHFSSYLKGGGIIMEGNLVYFTDEARKKHEKNVKNRIVKSHLHDELDSLFWQNPTVFKQLCDYCQNWPCSEELSDPVKYVLIEKGFLYEGKNVLPSLTNEVVYEAMTGEEPFWLS